MKDRNKSLGKLFHRVLLSEWSRLKYPSGQWEGQVLWIAGLDRWAHFSKHLGERYYWNLFGLGKPDGAISCFRALGRAQQILQRQWTLSLRPTERSPKLGLAVGDPRAAA